ncbi:hypothetical protein MERGE_001874 [Pneumocystis wakefieldiae]|uniref:Exosome complex protein n=1 Tax=Pneumocystis wakefieldiae TaxID=38082 RepID=A0A899FV85_9ASCO|nr:hypothetical protein MERGE_001874 [Pneumocystis wakefieldiae]
MVSKIQPNEGDLSLLMENLKERLFCLEKILFELKLNNQNNLSELSSKLPLVPVFGGAFSLFNCVIVVLKLNQVDLKDHAVMKELKRVEEYVLKIKEIEMSLSKRNSLNPSVKYNSDSSGTLALNKHAASRIIAHDLSQNTNDPNKKESLDIQDSFNLNMPPKGRVHIRFQESDTKSSETCVDLKQMSIEKDLGTSTKHFQDPMVSMGSYSKTQNRTPKKQKKCKTSQG